MNKEQKNIETCLPENVLAEVANVPTDPQFRSLVEESFDPLQQQALQQACYDGYKEVVMYHQPYTFTSHVKQMKSNLILLLRRLWRFPFGRGTTASSDAGSSASASAPIRSLADMWQHYITRLKGNPEYGIPSRLSSLTDLPSAPLLLSDRKIGGVPEAVDGMSLVRLLCDSTSAAIVTEITDDNTYTINKGFPLTIFPNVVVFNFSPKANVTATSSRYGGGAVINGFVGDTLTVNGLNKQNGGNTFAIFDGTYKKLVCGIKEVNGGAIMLQNSGSANTNLEEIYAYNLERANCIVTWCNNGWWMDVYPNLRSIKAPKLKEVTNVTGIDAYKLCLIGAKCPLITSLEFEELESISGNLLGGSSCPNITELRMPKLKSVTGKIVYGNQANRASLALIEVGAMETKLDLSWWNPTDKGATFLSNFKTYIAERLADKGSGKTLTLSQEVRNAIHAAEDEYGIENIIITQKGWTISPAPN